MSDLLTVRTEPQLRFVYLVVGQMLVIVVFLSFLRSLTVEYFVVLSFMIILLTTQFTAPLTLTLNWRLRLRWIVLGWLVVFSYVVWQRVSALLK